MGTIYIIRNYIDMYIYRIDIYVNEKEGNIWKDVKHGLIYGSIEW